MMSEWLGGSKLSRSRQKSPMHPHSRPIDLGSNTRLTRHTTRISHELDRKSCKSSLLHEVHVTVPLQEFKITHPVKIILRAQFHFRVLDDLG